MKRRSFTAPPDDQRCAWDITLRTDGSGARCMRRATVGTLCSQHAKMDEQMRAAMQCCGGNDESPPSHCSDCEETGCDCEDPGSGLYSMECPVHNWNPRPKPEVPDGVPGAGKTVDGKE